MRLDFFIELRRRHVYRVAVAYAVMGWLLIEFCTQVFPVLHMPEWTQQLVVLVILLGFPFILVLAWAFELTPDGLRRTEPVHSPQARTHEERRRAGRILDFVIIGVLMVALVLALWRPWLYSNAADAVPEKGVLVAGQPSANPLHRYSIAVLPFTNNNKAYDQRFFSDGLSESLIIALSQYPALTVIGRASSFKLRSTTLDSRQIGKRLDVAYLLEGSVSHAGGVVRIRAELVETTDGRTVWSNSYDRPFDNLFALQDAITKSVVNALEVKLLHSTSVGAIAQTDRPPSGNLEAYNAFLRGNYYFNEGTEASLRQAIDAFQQAIDADPRYATAHAALSMVWSTLVGASDLGQARGQAYDQARSEAETAVSLDGNLSKAYIARGYLSEMMLDLENARADYKHAYMLEPSSVLAIRGISRMQASSGDIDAAVRLVRQAIRHDPLQSRSYYFLSLYQTKKGDYDAALEALKRGVSMHPTNPFYARFAELELLRGHPEEALRIGKSESNEESRHWILALASTPAGDLAGGDRALQWLIGQRADVMAYQIAQVYAYRGDADKMFHWLDRAWRQRDSGMVELLYDPIFEPYYGDPRFAEVCHHLGVPVPGPTS